MRLAAIFSDHMVMQRDKDNYIFGESEKDERITVSIDDISVSEDVKVGSWSFKIPAHKAGGPYDMTIEAEVIDESVIGDAVDDKDGDRTSPGEAAGEGRAKSPAPEKTTKVIHDVLYGEVWLDNGQSNIEFELQNARGGQEELAMAAFPEIRYFKSIKTPVVDEEVLKAEESLVWHKLTDGDFAELSGVGYYYAVKLYKELGVPIGMIDCYQGGSSITCWLEHGILEEMPEGKVYLDEFAEATKGQTEEDYNKALNEYNAMVEKHLTLANKAKQENPDITQEELDEIAGCYPWPPPVGLKSAFRPGGLIETMMKRVAPYTVKGIIYYQGEEDAIKNYKQYEQTGVNSMYENLLVRLMEEYRELFDDKDLPIAVLQLPMFIARNEEDMRDWAYLREAQEKAVLRMKDSKVILVSLIDAGEYDNVHPVDKKTPGVRTAVEVLSEIYDNEDAGAVDMQLESAKRDGSGIELSFSRTYGEVVLEENELIDLRKEGVGKESAEIEGTGKEAEHSGHIYGFEVSTDGKDYYVPESFVEGEHIRIKNTKSVKYIRYGFFNYGKVNVYNKKGMPLRPFSIELDI